MTEEDRKRLEARAELALTAMRRGVRLAFLQGDAYDPDGSGKAYWEAKDREEKLAAENLAATQKSA